MTERRWAVLEPLIEVCRPAAKVAPQNVRQTALGRSRGGFGTKACVIADAIGRAVTFVLAPAQDHEHASCHPAAE